MFEKQIEKVVSRMNRKLQIAIVAVLVPGTTLFIFSRTFTTPKVLLIAFTLWVIAILLAFVYREKWGVKK